MSRISNLAVMPALAAVLSAGASAQDVQTLHGACQSESRISGAANAPFSCDSAVIVFFDNNNSHLMVQFGMKSSPHADLLGFAGIMRPDGQVLDVDHLYFTPGKAQSATGSTCRFSFSPPRMTAIACNGTATENNQPKTAVVHFAVKDG